MILTKIKNVIPCIFHNDQVKQRISRKTVIFTQNKFMIKSKGVVEVIQEQP